MQNENCEQRRHMYQKKITGLNTWSEFCIVWEEGKDTD